MTYESVHLYIPTLRLLIRCIFYPFANLSLPQFHSLHPSLSMIQLEILPASSCEYVTVLAMDL